MPLHFLIPASPRGAYQPGDDVTLSSERSHYLCKVLRARLGDTVQCFDGNGRRIRTVVKRANTKQALLQVETVASPTARSEPRVHVGISILKGQAMDRALQQATELGTNEITILAANRSNVQLAGERVDNKLSHWSKIIAGACEQCGQLYLPTLNDPVSVAAFIEKLQVDPDVQTMILEHTAPRLPTLLAPASRAVLIGPEGGWDEAEQTLFDRVGVQRFSLGSTVLRAETVPAVALALLNHIQQSSASLPST